MILPKRLGGNMIKPLRKRHLQIWIACAVLIPLGIISAVAVRPGIAKDKLLQPSFAPALPTIIKTLDKEDYTISVRSNGDKSTLQLEWINKKTLRYPTATIYKAAENTKDIKNAELIGRIEARGTYHFPLNNYNETIQQLNNHNIHFIIYDFIHQQIIDSITF
jgi:hypothetical protein